MFMQILILTLSTPSSDNLGELLMEDTKVLYVRHSPYIEEYLRSKLVACKNILNYEAEVQSKISYINCNSSTMGKAKTNAKKRFFILFTST